MSETTLAGGAAARSGSSPRAFNLVPTLTAAKNIGRSATLASTNRIRSGSRRRRLRSAR